MESRSFKAILSVLLMCMLHFALNQNKALAGDLLKIYYEQTAQVELINSEGSRVLIDVHDPEALSSPPTANDVLLTTHNHGDHRRLDFIKAFPGKQIDVKTGDLKLKGVTIRSIASAHNEGDDFKEENGTNYIFIVDIAGLRVAHFGDIGQEALTPEQLKILGKVDIAITQLANSFSDMTAANKKGFNLMAQIKPKIIIPTHISEPICAKISVEKWIGYNSYKKYLSFSIDNLPESTTIIFMGNNANILKLPYKAVHFFRGKSVSGFKRKGGFADAGKQIALGRMPGQPPGQGSKDTAAQACSGMSRQREAADAGLDALKTVLAQQGGKGAR